MSREIFIRGTGQEDNIGDVVLRREMFARLRPAGRLHLFLGEASGDFIAALELAPSDIVYSDMGEWKRAALRAALRRRAWFVDKPGEIMVTRDVYRGQRSLLPLILAVRASGGRVLRLGIGQRSVNTEVVPAFRRLYSLSSLVAWRDIESAAAFRIGEVMPDWGFAPASTAEGMPRKTLVLSYRGDRDILSSATLDGVRHFAEKKELSIVVVTQVGRDETRTRELAEALGGVAAGWPEGITHAVQEERLREIYRGAAAVFSDRLHVLIVAATEGAVPVNVVDEPDRKVARHFDAIGYRNITVLGSGRAAGEIADVLDAQLVRRGELLAALAAAGVALDDLTRRALGRAAR
ncbi:MULTISPECIES: polysaccharide pyruvyl transferase family protein [unclassified Rathayibacter]|uniref:polysaccharide pyruvyl transferase family protein n=1 Tax=unclassified Rathayibacter TaxID=2609250 RepID=UPI00188C9BCF|nr:MULTISPECIES: polysaccharide pyruvyl transferase family protein [unclassified Rathayibacter]MBF4463513.1 polysaccharide pyruvyl transferase family protein [Rathayibacter sp. VKM Ac-2879]MBF4504765.1 polysaccharide pyruvyl transferase family protein [Rathayibacter sp. VKM Ac-2878]